MFLKIRACVTGFFTRLRHESDIQRRLESVTFGRGGNFSRRDIDQTSRLIEDDDVVRYAGQQHSVWHVDEGGLVNPSTGTAVRWVDGRGWIKE